LGPHSKGDDTRSPEQLASLKAEKDPLLLVEKRLDPATVQTIKQETIAEVKHAFKLALTDPEAVFAGAV